MNKEFSKVVSLPERDSGITHSIIRLNNMHIGKGKGKYKRRTALVIRNVESGKWILRYVMGAGGLVKGLTLDAISIDYDGIDALNLKTKQDVKLVVKKASVLQRQIWLCTHPDLIVSTSFKLCWIGMLLTLDSVASKLASLLG
ncbi:hypothetical protein [Vibrio sp. 1180_3]|uniref:hypothetical protein n=1 Tax=Vibrio sp. 1180_3 TaxID=2528832 RepID=UPI0024066870|nr:hypothetical protein [Vibrio sp. 1180_3]MDF9399056.1 hypothetical protein [Vibrio sp. 1180_3]